MKLRNLAGAALLGVGSVAAANGGLRYDGDLDSPLVGDEGTFRWRGMDVAYTEGGDPDDPDLVLLHGINAAASSGEWREVFGDLTADYHVIAPDFPGYGRSDRPPLRYSAALYEDFVRDFLSTFDEPAVVASSLSAAYAAAADDVDFSGFVASVRRREAGTQSAEVAGSRADPGPAGRRGTVQPDRVEAVDPIFQRRSRLRRPHERDGGVDSVRMADDPRRERAVRARVVRLRLPQQRYRSGGRVRGARRPPDDRLGTGGRGESADGRP